MISTTTSGARLPVLAALAAVLSLVLTACGGDGGEASETQTRTVTHVLGSADIPVAPQNLVVLDEFAALNLLSVGVRPASALGSNFSTVGAEVLRTENVPLTMVGSAGADLEQVAAAQPDLIVLSSSGELDAQYPQLSEIAPTVALPGPYTTPWRDLARAVGTSFDRQQQTDATIARIEARIAETRGLLAARPQSLSVLGSFSGQLIAPAPTTPLAQVIGESGYTRPAAQDQTATAQSTPSVIFVGAEQLLGQDADVVAGLGGPSYSVDELMAVPTYGELPAVRDGRTVTADGEMWFGTHLFGISWLADDLHTIAGGGRDLQTGAQAPELWRAFAERR